MCTFQGPGLQKTPPKFHEKTPREREERMKIVAGEGKKERNFGRSGGKGGPVERGLGEGGSGGGQQKRTGQSRNWPQQSWPKQTHSQFQGFGFLALGWRFTVCGYSRFRGSEGNLDETVFGWNCPWMKQYWDESAIA